MDKSFEPTDQRVNDFLLWLRVERGRAASTLESYKRDLMKFEHWIACQNLSIESMKESDIIKFLRHLQTEGFSQSTVARTMVSVRSFFKF